MLILERKNLKKKAIMKREILKMNKFGKEQSETGRFWKGKIRKRTIINRKDLKTNKPEKEKMEK